jgi:hypothetical protein
VTTGRDRKLVVSRLIAGETIAFDCVNAGAGVRWTRPTRQITGHPALTPHALGATGNDGALSGITDQQVAAAEAKIPAIARLLADRGFRGWFGIDWLIPTDPAANPILIEINPRLTASLTLHGERAAIGDAALLGMHLAALAGRDLDGEARVEQAPCSQLIAHRLADSRSAQLTALGATKLVTADPMRPLDVGSECARLILRDGLDTARIDDLISLT